MKIIRRIILFLAIIISVLWIEAVYADMGAPEMREVEAVVINPAGTDYYDYNGTVKGHLDKDDVVFIVYEYDGKYTIGIKKDSGFGYEYTETIGDVTSLDDFSIVQDEIDPTTSTDNSITKYDKSQKARVNAEEGVDIYTGPSSIYKKVGHIKNGTLLTYKYSSYGTYIYVEYDGVKGWVSILNGKVLIQNDVQYIFKTDVVTECGTIPKNSITTPIYRTDMWTHKALFEYNGCEFMHNTMRDNEIISFYPYDKVLLKEVSVYEYADVASTVLVTVPAGERITLLAMEDSTMRDIYYGYVEYNGVRGWIVDPGDIIDWNTPGTEPENLIIEDTIKIEEVEEPKVDEDITPMVTKKFGITTFILLCAFGVSLLVITALVIIILVNRSKAAKKEEVKAVEEPKEEK
jgi:hypothetical protein